MDDWSVTGLKPKFGRLASTIIVRGRTIMAMTTDDQY